VLVLVPLLLGATEIIVAEPLPLVLDCVQAILTVRGE